MPYTGFISFLPPPGDLNWVTTIVIVSMPYTGFISFLRMDSTIIDNVLKTGVNALHGLHIISTKDHTKGGKK